MIKVVVCGAYGKMGRAVLNAVHNDSDLMLVGAVDVMSKGDDIGSLIGIDKIGINVKKDLQEVLTETSADVVVDFTNPNVVMNNIRIILKNRVYPVVGTTGLTDENKKK